MGEKATHSLEPLLATPITTFELLAGKSLAAAIPAIFAGYLSFGLFIGALPLIGVSKPVFQYITGSTWLLAILVAGPLMAIASVNFAIFVSSRVNDPTGGGTDFRPAGAARAGAYFCATGRYDCDQSAGDAEFHWRDDFGGYWDDLFGCIHIPA